MARVLGLHSVARRSIVPDMVRAWTLTDGDPDAETRCLGVAEAIADRVERRRVSPRAPWRWFAPLGPVDPLEAPDHAAGPIAPRRGWPDVVIATGRQTPPYLASIRRASRSGVLTVFLGDSVLGARAADIVAVGEGSGVQGANVIRTVAGPHRIDAIRLAAARGGTAPGPETDGPRVAVLLGGRRRRWSSESGKRLAAGLSRLAGEGATLLACARRDAGEDLDLAVDGTVHYLWDRAGRDPQVALMAHADAIVVAGDDRLALDEALSAGRAVFAFRPSGLSSAAAIHLDRLEGRGLVRPFAGRLEPCACAPVDAAGEIARAITALSATRSALKPRAERRANLRKRETNGPTTR